MFSRAHFDYHARATEELVTVSRIKLIKDTSVKGQRENTQHCLNFLFTLTRALTYLYICITFTMRFHIIFNQGFYAKN